MKNSMTIRTKNKETREKIKQRKKERDYKKALDIIQTISIKEKILQSKPKTVVKACCGKAPQQLLENQIKFLQEELALLNKESVEKAFSTLKDLA